jgi:hypothetical protein
MSWKCCVWRLKKLCDSCCALNLWSILFYKPVFVKSLLCLIFIILFDLAFKLSLVDVSFSLMHAIVKFVIFGGCFDQVLERIYVNLKRSSNYIRFNIFKTNTLMCAIIVSFLLFLINKHTKLMRTHTDMRLI